MENLSQHTTHDLSQILFPELLSSDEIIVHIYPTVREQDYPQDFLLSELIAEIRTSNELCDKILQIRNAQSEEERKALKRKLLPAFRPCSYNETFTGIIQFDNDYYDLESSARLKNILIENVPSLVYAFVSPSMGLKFAVLTDINSIDEITLSTAYFLSKDRIQTVLDGTAIGLNIKFDDRMQEISRLCYMSYDPDAYFNPEPAEHMVLSRDVNREIVKSKKPSVSNLVKAPLISPSSFSTTTNQTNITQKDKEVLLRAIDAIAGNKKLAFQDKDEKIKFANAVVNIFGLTEGFDIILNTVKLFGNDDRYLKSLIKNNNNFSIATIIFFAKRCGFKETTDTFKNNSTSGNTERFEYVPKDPTRLKRYSAEEAIRLIDHSVQRFFDHGISTQLIVEMGVGKTQITLKKAIEYMDRLEATGQQKKIAIFVPSHKLGNESLKKLLEFETEEGFFCSDGDYASLGPKRYHKVIGGFNKYCHKLQGVPDEERKGLIRNPWECENCKHNLYCWYISQFFNQDNLIRIYPHNFLFQPSNYDKNYRPDFVIIDEDPSGHCIIERTYDENNSKIWKKILSDGLDSIENSDIHSAIKLLKLQIDGAKRKLTAAHGGGDHSLIITYGTLLEELEDLDVLMNEKWKVSVYDNKVHVHHKQDIDKKWLNAPVLYLNGTGSKEISNAIFGAGKFEVTEEIRVQYNPCVKVYQVMNQSFSMNQFENPEDGKGEKLKQQIFEIMTYFYHYTGACFVSYSSIIKEYLENHPSCDPERFMYFGDTRGKKAFEDKSIIVVIGRHCIPYQALSIKAKMLFGDLHDDIVVVDESMSKTTRIIELHDEDHDAEVSRQVFNDPMMRIMSKYYNEGEVLQSIHRLRLIHGTDPKTVIYLSNFVLDGLCVDKLIIRDDVVLKDVRMKLVKSIQNHGIIDEKPKTISSISGLTSTQVSNLKNKEWFSDNLFFCIDDRGRLIDRYMNQ